MRLFIATTLLLLAATFTQAQLAEFKTKGFEDSRWTCKLVTDEYGKDGEPVIYLIPINSKKQYKAYAEEMVWKFKEAGTYIITQRHDNKEVQLTIVVPEGGIETKQSYSLKRRDKYVG